jgi:hypothetical protein
MDITLMLTPADLIALVMLIGLSVCLVGIFLTDR